MPFSQPPRRLTKDQRSETSRSTRYRRLTLLYVWNLSSGYRIDSDGIMWRECFCAGLGNVFILLNSVSADADGPNEFPVFVKRNSPGEFDDAISNIAISDLP